LWQASAHSIEDGWTVEMRVPLSTAPFLDGVAPSVGHQLFPPHPTQGTSKTSSRIRRRVIGGIRRSSRICMASSDCPRRAASSSFPTRTTRQERIDPRGVKTPFNDGSRQVGGLGLDAKYGVTSGLTLDATINPDFGQVDADPAFVNLSAFEQFLSERRPFFVEGANIFKLQHQRAAVLFASHRARTAGQRERSRGIRRHA
jgi:hypothetical protein